jgi:hypothetical protein
MQEKSKANQAIESLSVLGHSAPNRILDLWVKRAAVSLDSFTLELRAELSEAGCLLDPKDLSQVTEDLGTMAVVYIKLSMCYRHPSLSIQTKLVLASVFDRLPLAIKNILANDSSHDFRDRLLRYWRPEIDVMTFVGRLNTR